MTAILDAGPLVALADQNDPMQPAIERLLRRERGTLIVPAPVTAEVDYLLGRRLGRRSRLAFIEDVAVGRFHVECLLPDEYTLVAELDRRYGDLDLGLADLSIVVLAGRFRTRRVVSFDERDFRSISSLQGGSFALLPADG
ncbi:MAG TPA: PIN domain-containing protein [Actinomycetota bacterium]